MKNGVTITLSNWRMYIQLEEKLQAEREKVALLREAVEILNGVKEYEFCINKIEDFLDRVKELEGGE